MPHRSVSPSPGSRAGLLPPSPLRTARASFPACRSSLANAPCGTRCCHVDSAWHHLHHTRLEPPHRHPVGECTSSVATAVIGFLSSGGWPNSLVMQDQMDVCPLARGVMLPVGATPIHPITGWRSLLPSSSSRTPISLPYGSLSLTGDVRGCHVPSQSQTNGVGALCPPVALLPMTRNGRLLVPAPVPFWPKPASTFGLLSVTMFIERSPGFALPSILAPSPSRC